MSTINVVAITHPGAVRTRNEDAIAVGPFVNWANVKTPISLAFETDSRLPCLVADGLGGQPAGEIASRIVSTSVISMLLNSTDPIEAIAAQALREANAVLYQEMLTNDELVTMGSTVAGVLIDGDALAVFNVGDSRVYRWQDGFLCQLSHDDAVAGDPSMVGQALGGMTEHVEIDPHVVIESWRAGRSYLICTDGLFNALSLDAMEAALAQPPLIAMGLLIEKALAAEASDNVSALLISRE